jgi:hypothetical protein
MAEVEVQPQSLVAEAGKHDHAEESQEADSREKEGNGTETSGKRDSFDKPRENGALKSDSFSKKIKASWKDSLSLRKDKMKDKRQPSISNLHMLPSSEDELQKVDKTGSLSKRIGRAVISSVNKLRRKTPAKDNGAKDEEQPGSDDSAGGSDEEGGTGAGDPEGDAAANSKDRISNPNNTPDSNTENPDASNPINEDENNKNNELNTNPPNNEEDDNDPEDPDPEARRINSMPNLNSPGQFASPPQRSNSDSVVLVSCMRTPDTPKNPSTVKFNEIVTVRRTWAKKDYDRKGEVTWKLTPDKAVEIRNELNEFKKEMDIHEESRSNTHFY